MDTIGGNFSAMVSGSESSDFRLTQAFLQSKEKSLAYAPGSAHITGAPILDTSNSLVSHLQDLDFSIDFSIHL